MLHELAVPEADAGQRLDVWLEAQLTGCSRSLVARCIKDDRCTISPGKAKPGYRLRGGEQIAIEVPEVPVLEAVAEDIPVRVLHEDEAYIILDKDPGMVVHPAIGHPRGTLINAMLGLAAGAWHPGLIHRLDADTSGVIAVAKSDAALAFAQAAFKERRVRKRYLALLAGSPRSDVLRNDHHLGRHPKDFRKRAVVAPESRGARAAETSFVVRQRHDAYVVAEARPVTGRTHQIRVHASHLGHPILADAVYGRSSTWPPDAGKQARLQRQGLHAWRLELPHPNGQMLCVQAPVPADLAQLLDGDVQPLAD